MADRKYLEDTIEKMSLEMIMDRFEELEAENKKLREIRDFYADYVINKMTGQPGALILNKEVSN